MIAFSLGNSKRIVVLFSFIQQENVYSKQSQGLAVNSLFPTPWMLLPHEDTFINFPSRKSNKTIVIIKDVAITVPKAISIILVFLYLQTYPGGTHRNLVAWFRPEISKGAIQPNWFYFISYRLSNQPLWERSYARKYLFGIRKSAGAMLLPESWIETVHDYGFFKVFPRILCNHKYPFLKKFHLQAVYQVQKWWMSSCHSHTRFSEWESCVLPHVPMALTEAAVSDRC